MASGEPVSLASLLEREGPLSPQRALAILKDAARAVAENHAAGMLHLGLQPSAVFVTPEGQVLLAESPLARRIGEAPVNGADEPSAVPLYYPPEAARARPLDPRSDLFLLGGIFYHALTGRPPFEGPDPVSLALQYIRKEAPAITDAVPGIPVLVGALVHKLLRREPNERYQSAAELVGAIERMERLILKRQVARRTAPVMAQAEPEAIAPGQRHTTRHPRASATGDKKRRQLIVYASVAGGVLLVLLAVLLWPRGSSQHRLARAADKGTAAAAQPEAAVGSKSLVPEGKSAAKLPSPRPKTATPVAPKPEPKKDVKPEPSPPPGSRWKPIEAKGTEKSEDFAKRTEGIELSSVEDYIVTWQYAGPYREEGKHGPQGLFDVVFPPEKELAGTAAPAGEAPKWAPLPTRSDPTRPWLFDFKRMEGIYAENVAIYLRTRVNSPRKQEVELWAGSDDGIKVWLNRQQVHGNNVARAVGPDSDKVKVTLNKGWNDLLVKITQGKGDWAFCLRFRTLEGQKLDGIKQDPAGK